MAKKRKSGGRAKGQSGSKHRVACDKCGRLVPADKIKKVTKRTNLVDWQLQRELEKDGAFIGGSTTVQNLCVSCAIHTRRIKIRSRNDRKKRENRDR